MIWKIGKYFIHCLCLWWLDISWMFFLKTKFEWKQKKKSKNFVNIVDKKMTKRWMSSIINRHHHLFNQLWKKKKKENSSFIENPLMMYVYILLVNKYYYNVTNHNHHPQFHYHGIPSSSSSFISNEQQQKHIHLFCSYLLSTNKTDYLSAKSTSQPVSQMNIISSHHI